MEFPPYACHIHSRLQYPVPFPIHTTMLSIKNNHCLLESHSHSTNLHQLEPYSLMQVKKFLCVCLNNFWLVVFFFNNKLKHFVLGTPKNQRNTSDFNIEYKQYPVCGESILRRQLSINHLQREKAVCRVLNKAAAMIIVCTIHVGLCYSNMGNLNLQQ